MSDDILERARELLAFANDDSPVIIGLPQNQPPPYILIDKDALRSVCTALLAADERARALAGAARDAELEAYEAAAQICEHRASWSVLTTRLANAERKALLDAAQNIRIAGAAAIRARGQAKADGSGA